MLAADQMEKKIIKTAVIGVGNMGSKYAAILQDKSVKSLVWSIKT